MKRMEGLFVVGATLLIGVGVSCFVLGVRGRDAGSTPPPENPGPVARRPDATHFESAGDSPRLASEVEASLAPTAERVPLGDPTRAPAAFVLGTVVDAHGTPIAGAFVTLFEGPLLTADEERVVQNAETGTDGRFRFAVRSNEDPHGVRVSAPGFAPKERNQSPGVDVPFELALAGRWVGRLLGEGAARARVLRPPESKGLDWTRIDDGAGSFAYEQAPVGRLLRVEVVPESALSFEWTFELTEPGENVHDIQLGERRPLEVSVIDALTHRPVAGAQLSNETARGTILLGTSDADGRFRCDLQGPTTGVLDDPSADPGTIFLGVSAEGFFRSELWLGRLSRTRTCELVPAGILVGRVLEADGRPAAGATLTWFGPARIFDARFGVLALPETLETRADENGAFRLSGVLWGTGRADLVARSGTRERWALDALPANPFTPLELELRLPAARGLDGRVVWKPRLALDPPDLGDALAGTALRDPAPRVTVRLVDAQDRELARAATDALGRFSFAELPRGEWHVSVQGGVRGAPGETAEIHGFRLLGSAWRLDLVHGARAEAPRDAGAIPESGALTIAIPMPTRALAGTLRSAEGLPLAGREIGAELLRDPRAPPPISGFGARTDEQGAFRLSLPDFEELALRLSVLVGRSRLECVPAGTPIDWSLPEMVPVLFDPGDPGERWLVSWRGPRANEGGRCTDLARTTDGTLALELPAGTLELELQRAGAESRLMPPARVTVAARADGAPLRITPPR